MTKRILTLIFALALVLSVALPAVSMAGYEMYVYTANGKGLNCRTSPNVGNNLIKSIPFGTKVYVQYHLGNGWTCIEWGGAYDVAYVQTRFLVDYPPTKPQPQPTQQPGGGTTYYGDNATSVAQLNSIFRTYRRVYSPYRVTVQPTRATGWVNLRFAPTKESELISTHRANEQMLVIAELQDWYQVQDPQTGEVGFMSNKFVVR